MGLALRSVCPVASNSLSTSITRFLLATGQLQTIRPGVIRSMMAIAALILSRLRVIAGFFAAMLVGQLLLVLLDLPINLVAQRINRRIQILIGGIGENFVAGNMNGGFSFLDQLVDAQNHLGAGDVVKMTLNALQLVVHLVVQRRGAFQMMSAQTALDGMDSFLTGLGFFCTGQ